MKEKLKGVYTAIVTPFLPSGLLDEEGLRKNIRFQIESGIDGIVALGTTGETPTLTLLEQEVVIATARKETEGKVPLFVGTGTNATEKTVENTLKAKKMGADGALIVTPYYNRPTQEGIFRHFAQIAERTGFPICVYNMPARTGQNIQTETLQRLAAIPHIIGVKESSGSFSQLSDVIELVTGKKQDFQVMTGDDAFLIPTMALGGHGVISVVANLFPKEMKAIYTAAEQGNFKKAKDLYFTLYPFIKVSFIETNPIPIKAAMEMAGLAGGNCRLPLCELSLENRDKLRRVLNDLLWILKEKE